MSMNKRQPEREREIIITSEHVYVCFIFRHICNLICRICLLLLSLFICIFILKFSCIIALRHLTPFLPNKAKYVSTSKLLGLSISLTRFNCLVLLVITAVAIACSFKSLQSNGSNINC